MKHSMPTVVILGGTSAVAMAYARDAAHKGEQVILVGRNQAKLSENLLDIQARGSEKALIHTLDLGDAQKVTQGWQTIIQSVDKIDRVLIAYGVLGNQEESQNDTAKCLIELETNFISAALWSEEAFRFFRKMGRGQLTVIGSVAGDRGRQSNYHYGAAKGGLDIFLQGMMHRAAKLKEAKVGVTLIKPGFIDTPMTDHIEKGGPLWASPEKIARIIRKSERRGKRIVYAPWFWRYILMIIRYVPFFIFKRSSL